jgi:GABA(A) receptor-associated protein
MQTSKQENNSDDKVKFFLNSDFNTRSEKANNILKMHEKCVPIIVLKHPTSKMQTLDKFKFIVPKDLTVGQFNYVIRKRLKLKPEQSTFLFVNKKLATSSQLINIIYDEWHDDDGFLYMTYAEMETFG